MNKRNCEDCYHLRGIIWKKKKPLTKDHKGWIAYSQHRVMCKKGYLKDTKGRDRTFKYNVNDNPYPCWLEALSCPDYYIDRYWDWIREESYV